MAPTTGESLRICLLTYRGNPRSGGQGIYIRLLSRELAAMGHRVDVWSGQPYPELYDDARIRLVKVPSLDLWNEDDLFRVPTLRELRDPLNREEWYWTMLGAFAEPRMFSKRVARAFHERGDDLRYDVVHDNQCLGYGLLDVQRMLPVVTTIHHPITRDQKVALESAPNLYRRFNLWRFYRSFLPMQIAVARQMDRVLTISDASGADVVEDFGLDPSRTRMIGNGINLEVFKPYADIERGEDRLITTLSADVPLKGLRYLIDALAELRKERPNLSLTVIGTPMKSSSTSAHIARLGLEDAIHFTGRVPAEEIARRYAESTVAVVSSLYEGFGFPAGEAMACEVPLVSTRGGALPEVVGEGGKTGILVEPGSGAELARGIRSLLDATPEHRRNIGEAGRRRVLELFTWRATAERTVENYREIIERRRRLEGERRVFIEIADDRLAPAAEPTVAGISARAARSEIAPLGS